MSCAVVVQPSVLSCAVLGESTGMDSGAVTTATCLAATLGAVSVSRVPFLVALASGRSSSFFADSRRSPHLACCCFAS